MDKLIPLNKGIHRQPSVGTDGELSELVNLIPQNGELVNVRGLNPIGISSEYKLLCVHKVVGRMVYIFSHGENVEYHVEGEDESHLLGIPDDVEGIHKGVAIGNIVVLTSTNHNVYLRWTGDGYKCIGTQIPYLDIRIWSDYEWFDLGQDKRPEFPLENSNSVYIEEWIKENAKREYDTLTGWVKKDYFIESFFIRYAYRLYDNSIAYCSPPILIPCATKYPSAFLEIARINNGNGIEVQTKGYKSKVYVSPNIISGDIEKYKGFSDIIRSVEFYISPIKMNGSNVHFVSQNNYLGQNSIVGDDSYVDLSNRKIDNAYGVWFTNDKLDDEVLGASSFHLLKEVEYGTFINSETITLNGEVDGESVAGFDLRDIWSRDSLVDSTPFKATVGENLFAYNSRLFLSKTKTWPYQGVDVGGFFPYSKSGTKIKAVYVKIESNSGTIVVNLSKKGNTDYHIGYYADRVTSFGSSCRWFFYPNEDATEVTFELDSSYLPFVTNKLKRHPMLRGCYLYNGMDTVMKVMGETLPQLQATGTKYEVRSNEVAYSNPGNMFIIPDILRFRVGEGEILGLATSSVALSEGQFGQFPIYVFCSDGIWVLTIAKDGSIEKADPVSRDVCNNPESITQIDGAVVFTTDQGLMMIQGSEVVNLSGAMEGYNVNESIYFPSKTEGVVETKFFAQYDKGDFDNLVVTETRDFRDILKSCKIAYDYVNKMLRIFPTGDNFSGKYYVYSLESGEYATVYQKNEITTVVSDYPSSIVQIGCALYRPSERDNDKNTKKGLLLTRPIMLDEPFALKKLQDIRLHYSKFDGSSKCHVIVYVSNDGTNWMQLKSLRRRSYKYYRFAIITDMKDMDALSGMVLRYEVERNNKLR